MTPPHAIQQALEVLALAREIATYARNRGATNSLIDRRSTSTHLGAVLADSILQAGLNYRTVVHARVTRIVDLFPHAKTLGGVVSIVNSGMISDFLMWKHPEKIDRFVKLVLLLEQAGVHETAQLRVWIQDDSSRKELLLIPGIGPKTVDYLACLVGVDCIPIDRHLRSFAADAGIEVKDYDRLKLVFSYAADLLGLPRRSFDQWVWQNSIASNSARA
ncbi:hypothetical protein A5906_17830 [Bradyrhizobium sacchari]|uniref:Uncharacterized protein n=1 Tax=Bradyrhizobium sacchari TaxID=1399419 RepID=A0A560JCR6_9BRAD|nr:hypothetical protein [Bradyrhizobium sacchari]OPY93651.1 hypothetical protein A5906_17830 [Bradyrhizobium sacchari]TWB50804.1 hypothetical protein FBZ94_111136 [Bradyrhizobium sacchari]TWB68988.1 hypothetical protein FBZ95_110108 [Bradyrhizobium sacchari]